MLIIGISLSFLDFGRYGCSQSMVLRLKLLVDVYS
jgi:hypothetical protein